jgi:hypothetical protein
MPGKAENLDKIVRNDFKQPQVGPKGEAQGCAE